MGFDARQVALDAKRSKAQTVEIKVPWREDAQIRAIIELSKEMESQGFKYVDRHGRSLRFTRDVGFVIAIEAHEEAERERSRQIAAGELIQGSANIYRDRRDRELLSKEFVRLAADGIGWLDMKPLPWTIFDRAHFRHRRSGGPSPWWSTTVELTTVETVEGLGRIFVLPDLALVDGRSTHLERWLEEAGVKVTTWTG
jgi:hypothetical protein